MVKLGTEVSEYHFLIMLDPLSSLDTKLTADITKTGSFTSPNSALQFASLATTGRKLDPLIPHIFSQQT